MKNDTTNISFRFYKQAVGMGAMGFKEGFPHSYNEFLVSWRNPNTDSWHEPSVGTNFSDYQRTVLSEIAKYTEKLTN